jgi:Protein of unknown function (DUF2948)
MPQCLRLIALDEEDLAIISANLQDAVIRVGDMAYLARTKRFALVAARFDWVCAAGGSKERCQTGLHFERVLKVTRSGFDQTAPDTHLNLLSIAFRPGDPPSGTVELTFSGGAALRLDVECLEAQMRDLGPRWKARAQPDHPIEDVSASGEERH